MGSPTLTNANSGGRFRQFFEIPDGKNYSLIRKSRFLTIGAFDLNSPVLQTTMAARCCKVPRFDPAGLITVTKDDQMAERVQEPVQGAANGRGPDKLLAIGAYGETVAAYRYLVLAEKAPADDFRREFADMADEEQDHKQRLQKLVADMYPGQDFVLTPEDKELVVTGPRLLEVRDESEFRSAMELVLQTERKTAKFYANHGKFMPDPGVRALFHELAEEGVEHYQRLKKLANRAGVQDVAE